MPFLNEYAVNMTLLNGHFSDFCFPKMLEAAPGRCLVFEYIEGIPCRPYDPAVAARCLSAILEFNALRATERKPLMQRLLFPLLERPPYRIVQKALRLKLGWITVLKILCLLIGYSSCHRKQSPVLLHNDLAFSNTILTPDDRLVFMDFEDAVSEGKWPLVDAVDILFDRQRLCLDLGQIRTYLQALSARCGISFTAKGMRAQVRVCLLRHVLFAMSSTVLCCDTKERMAAFLPVLLSGDAFAAWFCACQGTSPNA